MRADLHLDLEAVLRSTLHPNSKLLWLYVLSRGKGKGLQQDRPDIAHALNLNVNTITTAAQELQDAGWMACERLPESGGPKAYRILRPYRGTS